MDSIPPATAISASPAERLSDRRGTELDRGEVAEAASELSDRRASTGDDDGTGHDGSSRGLSSLYDRPSAGRPVSSPYGRRRTRPRHVRLPRPPRPALPLGPRADAPL